MGADYGLIEGSIKSTCFNLSSSSLMADTTAGVHLGMYPLIGTSSLRRILNNSFVKPMSCLFLNKH